MASGAWEEAKAQFEKSLRDGETPEALDGYAQATRWLGEAEASLRARESAFRAYREQGDARAAALAAAWLGYDLAVFRGNAAVARGWFAQARRLLEGSEDSAERGWLAFFEAEVALVVEDDPDRAGELAAIAADLGHRLGVSDVEMLGRSLEGLARVAKGELEAGMRLLDEATGAAVAGELSGLHYAGGVCCHLIYACERVHDVDRAAQWCDTVHGFCQQWSVPQLLGFCRAHYASVLMWRGEWELAESELTAAMSAFERGAPALAFEAVLRFAELRRYQGRLEEASELCDQAAWHPAARLCRAQIALERGELRAAADLVARYLRSLAPGEKLGRAPALELAIQVHAQTGELEAAEANLEELGSIVSAAQTDPLCASLRICEGIVAHARKDDDDARTALEDAVDLSDRAGSPYETARARLMLGRTLLRVGRPSEAIEELQGGLETMRSLGAMGEVTRAEALLEKATSKRPMRERTSLTERELDVLRLAAQGHTDGEIASRLVVSPHTVHRHMANIRAKLNERSKAGAVARASRDGLL